MYYSKINPNDIANGTGVRVTLFVSGCSHHCKGCFQPETWNFKYGQPFTQDTINLLIKYLKPDYITGLTLLGGDPMEPENQPDIALLITQIKKELPDKDIWLYTGCTLEQLLDESSYYHTEHTGKIINNINILVDGPFKEEEKDISFKFRGSGNQRIIKLRQTKSPAG